MRLITFYFLALLLAVSIGIGIGIFVSNERYENQLARRFLLMADNNVNELISFYALTEQGEMNKVLEKIDVELQGYEGVFRKCLDEGEICEVEANEFSFVSRALRKIQNHKENKQQKYKGQSPLNNARFIVSSSKL